jgi:hypothetical protein
MEAQLSDSDKQKLFMIVRLLYFVVFKSSEETPSVAGTAGTEPASENV